MDFTKFSKKKRETSSRKISFKLTECLAKTYNTEEETNIPGRDVFSHCLIVGYIARALLNRIPKWMKKSLFPSNSEIVAAAHDVGKVCPTFQEKIRRGKNNSANYRYNSYPGLESADPEFEKLWGYHAGLSQVTLDYCKAGSYIPEIVGQHHGFSPPKGKIKICLANAERYGGESWQKLRETLIDELKLALNCSWPIIKNEKQAKLVAGLTTVADWLGSTARFDDPKNERWMKDVQEALDGAGFFPLVVQKGLSFQQIFDFTPRPIQKSLIQSCDKPGVYILEAPMGIGKTEAALCAAYKMLETDQASGIYFALPTQLTSDKIFERMNKFLEKIIPVDCPNRLAVLAHANSKIKLMELGGEGAPGGSWFSGHKRELLAPFGVGTIDQALMSSLNVKHGFVRAFGLAGKVVILDEIHSYDAYTGTIIDTLIENLVAWKCTVIILSATLTKTRRDRLLGFKSSSFQNHYPLISLQNERGFAEVKVPAEIDKAVKVHISHSDRFAIEEALKRAEQGQQILWIENTVQEAQQMFKELAATAQDCGIKCALLHSRYIRDHRDSIESEWIDLFGKDRGKRMEQGRILVGTQILEQSLDIDADFLVTRLCPTDMLLQRIGRLWRHSTLARSSFAVQEAWILSHEIESSLSDPKYSLGKSYYVYSPYYLLRTLELFKPLSGKDIFLPTGIRELIESTYAEREDTGIMLTMKKDLEKKKSDLQRLANVGLSEGIETQSDDWAPTRYSEQESCEVLVIKGIELKSRAISLTLIDGNTLDLPTSGSTLQNRKEFSLILSRNLVKVAERNAPPPPSLEILQVFKGYLYIDEDNPTLRIAKLCPSDNLISIDGTPFSKNLNYSQTLGYYIEE